IHSSLGPGYRADLQLRSPTRRSSDLFPEDDAAHPPRHHGEHDGKEAVERSVVPRETEDRLLEPRFADFELGGTFIEELPVLEQRSEEHTSELQSRENLVCRLLLEKKK